MRSHLTERKESKPVILCIGGFDPSGCAGLHADIQTVTAIGGHCMSVASCQTVQNAKEMIDVVPTPIRIFEHQLKSLEQLHHIDAIKIGATCSEEIILTLCEFIDRQSSTSVVLDPIIASSSGKPFLNTRAMDVLKSSLIPKCCLITPNQPELLRLTNESIADSAILSLLNLGATNVLLTGGHDQTAQTTLKNSLYGKALGELKIEEKQTWSIPRHKGQFRGTGCLLSSAIASYLAFGYSIIDAVEAAQTFASQAISNAYLLGGTAIPDRRLL